MNPLLKDCFEVAAWIAGIIGGLFATFKALREARRNRELREEDLRWRKAELARRVMTDLRSSDHVRNAFRMLDWDNRPYEIAPGDRKSISGEDIEKALRTTNVRTFTPAETFIRDCFDSLFDAMAELEHYLRTGLVEFADIRSPFDYYVSRLRYFEPALSDFLRKYEYHSVLAFLMRFGSTTAVSIR